MSVNFCPEIQWTNNPLLLPASLFNIKVPNALSASHVRAPKFVDVAGMQRARQSTSVRNQPGPMIGVGGLVTNDFNLRLTGFKRLWRRLPSTHGPCKFQFSGGNLHLDLTLSVYILNTFKPIPGNVITDKLFSAIYGHELLHVLDNIDILTNWLLPKLKSQPTVSSYLIQSKTVNFGRSRDPIAQVENNFHSYIYKKLQTEIRNLFLTENNRRGARRDSPREYQHVQKEIDALRIQQINQVSP